jgi:hypothetical protein
MQKTKLNIVLLLPLGTMNTRDGEGFVTFKCEKGPFEQTHNYIKAKGQQSGTVQMGDRVATLFKLLRTVTPIYSLDRHNIELLLSSFLSSFIDHILSLNTGFKYLVSTFTFSDLSILFKLSFYLSN